ncbi:uncharacterized protein DS421_14g464930 [Arachis hypogaea]|nr:uncharacterized protein DS421_14g464930 [Arachis hypogaea]
MSLLLRGRADCLTGELTNKKQVPRPPDDNLNQENTPHKTTDSRVFDAGTLSVALVQHQEWEFDEQVSSAKLFHFGSILLIRELGNYTEPLQTVMPTTPSCRTPIPPSHQISPEMTRMEKNPSQYTPIKAKASYEGRLHLVLLREDLCTLLPCCWDNSNIVQWMCLTFNDSESLRFKDDFYCIPPEILETMLQKRNLDSFREVPTVSYVGLGPHFVLIPDILTRNELMRAWYCLDTVVYHAVIFYMDVAYDSH